MRWRLSAMRKYKDSLAEAIHENAEALYKIGEIDRSSMDEYDISCLVDTNE